MKLESSRHYGSWSGAQIEAFLADSRLPLRLGLTTRNGLLIVPVWFEYRAGHFLSCSPESSLLVRSLRTEPDVAFDVSTNDIPYRGVRGRGRARCTTASDKTALENLLKRYLAGSGSALGQWLLGRSGAEAIIEIESTWLTSWDFSGRMGSIEKIATRHPGASL